MKRYLLMSLFLSFLIPKSTFAFFPEIDHCAITDSDLWYGQAGSSCATSFHQGSDVAYEFKLEEAYRVESIEGWIFPNGVFGAEHFSINLKVYEGTLFDERHFGQRPNTNNLLLSQMFYFDVDYQSAWRGIYDLDLELDKGTYWVSYEDGTIGAFTGLVRLNGATIPEPTSLLLFGLGAIGLMRKMKK